VCLKNNFKDYWKKSHKKNKCIIKGMIRWKIPKRSKKTFQISTYIFSGWEITKIVLTKQRSSSNETNKNE